MAQIKKFFINLLLFNGRMLKNVVTEVIKSYLKHQNKLIIQHNGILYRIGPYNSMFDLINQNSDFLSNLQNNHLIPLIDNHCIAKDSICLFAKKPNFPLYHNNEQIVNNLSSILKTQEFLMTNLQRIISNLETNNTNLDMKELNEIKQKLIACTQILQSQANLIKDINIEEIIDKELAQCRLKQNDSIEFLEEISNYLKQIETKEKIMVPGIDLRQKFIENDQNKIKELKAAIAQIKSKVKKNNSLILEKEAKNHRKAMLKLELPKTEIQTNRTKSSRDDQILERLINDRKNRKYGNNERIIQTEEKQIETETKARPDESLETLLVKVENSTKSSNAIENNAENSSDVQLVKANKRPKFLQLLKDYNEGETGRIESFRNVFFKKSLHDLANLLQLLCFFQNIHNQNENETRSCAQRFNEAEVDEILRRISFDTVHIEIPGIIEEYSKYVNLWWQRKQDHENCCKLLAINEEHFQKSEKEFNNKLMILPKSNTESRFLMLLPQEKQESTIDPEEIHANPESAESPDLAEIKSNDDEKLLNNRQSVRLRRTNRMSSRQNLGEGTPPVIPEKSVINLEASPVVDEIQSNDKLVNVETEPEMAKNSLVPYKKPESLHTMNPTSTENIASIKTKSTESKQSVVNQEIEKKHTTSEILRLKNFDQNKLPIVPKESSINQQNTHVNSTIVENAALAQIKYIESKKLLGNKKDNKRNRTNEILHPQSSEQNESLATPKESTENFARVKSPIYARIKSSEANEPLENKETENSYKTNEIVRLQNSDPIKSLVPREDKKSAETEKPLNRYKTEEILRLQSREPDESLTAPKKSSINFAEIATTELTEDKQRTKNEQIAKSQSEEAEQSSRRLRRRRSNRQIALKESSISLDDPRSNAIVEMKSNEGKKQFESHQAVNEKMTRKESTITKDVHAKLRTGENSVFGKIKPIEDKKRVEKEQFEKQPVAKEILNPPPSNQTRKLSTVSKEDVQMKFGINGNPVFRRMKSFEDEKRVEKEEFKTLQVAKPSTSSHKETRKESTNNKKDVQLKFDTGINSVFERIKTFENKTRVNSDDIGKLQRTDVSPNRQNWSKKESTVAPKVPIKFQNMLVKKQADVGKIAKTNRKEPLVVKALKPAFRGIKSNNSEERMKAANSTAAFKNELPRFPKDKVVASGRPFKIVLNQTRKQIYEAVNKKPTSNIPLRVVPNKRQTETKAEVKNVGKIPETSKNITKLRKSFSTGNLKEPTKSLEMNRKTVDDLEIATSKKLKRIESKFQSTKNDEKTNLLGEIPTLFCYERSLKDTKQQVTKSVIMKIQNSHKIKEKFDSHGQIKRPKRTDDK